MATHADRLATGATPVLVEGPIDALAITLASPDHVGVAPLGTALTDTQADTLTPYLDTTTGAPGVIVATDPDLAGQLATERDYWMLTARGGDPRHATLPPVRTPPTCSVQPGPTPSGSGCTTPARWPTPSSTNASPTCRPPRRCMKP